MYLYDVRPMYGECSVFRTVNCYVRNFSSQAEQLIGCCAGQCPVRAKVLLSLGCREAEPDSPGTGVCMSCFCLV